MTSLVDAITKSPSSVLVKSSSGFGEQAAKIISSSLEECVKNTIDDVLKEVQRSSDQISKKVESSLDGFGEVFHDTGVEAFSEWGIGIERAFLHLGQKLETGLTNSVARLSIGLKESVDDNVDKLNDTIEHSTKNTVETVGNFGIKHARHYKMVYNTEIKLLLASFFLIALSLLVIAISYASQVGITMHAFDFVFRNFQWILFFTFALLIANVIYQQTEGPNQSVGSSDKKKIIDNRSTTFIMIASLGFVAGYISHQLFTFKGFGFLSSFLVMVFCVIIVYRMLMYRILYRLYSAYRTFGEFKEYIRKERIASFKDD